jgi:hypothetical protein
MAEFLQQDVIELRVGNDEKIIDFFPPLGMCCEVRDCYVDTYFKRWEDYTLRHFITYHKMEQRKHRCAVSKS